MSRCWPASTCAGCPGGSAGTDSSLLARAFVEPIQLSPIVDPCEALAPDMVDGRIEGIVLRDRDSTYRDGSREGWWKVKPRERYQREAWRFDQR